MLNARLRLGFALGSSLSLSRAFSFSYTAPKSCDPIEISWSGGTGPFSLLLTTPSGTPRNVSIPDDASGSFTTTLNYTAGQSFIMTMSDSTGFGTGGNSDLLLVGSGTTNTQCNTTNPSPAFSFQSPSNAQQCGQYLLSGYGAATQPIQIHGLIPLGSSFTVDPPDTSSSYNWTVNVASGSRLLFFMTDGEGRLGSASTLLQIGSSSNSSCIDDNSPRSTVSSTTAQPTSTAASPSQSPGGVSQGGNNGAIIGGAVGGGVALLLAIILLIFCLKRRRVDPMKRYSRKRAKEGLDGMRALDLAPSTPSLHHEPNQLPPLDFEAHPFVLPPASSRSGGENVPMSPTTHSGRSQAAAGQPYLGHNARSPSQGTTEGGSSAAARKAAAAGPSAQGLAPPPRFVLHTDAGSVENMNAITVELPPTYNAAANSGSSAPASSNNTPPTDVGAGTTQSPSEAGNHSTDMHSQDHNPPHMGSSTANLTTSNH